MRKRLLLVLASLIFLVGAALAIRFLLGGSEDTWICVEEQWVKHGNPQNPPPESGCGYQKQGEFSNKQP